MNSDADRKKYSPMVTAVRDAFRSGQEDEALEPIVAVDVAGKPVGRLSGGDYVIFYDIRGEREIEITQSLTDEEFPHFERPPDTLLNFVTMIEYHSALKARTAFPPEGRIPGTLAEVLSRAGLRCVKIAESEKAIHVGYFMNGKNESVFPGEERIVVPSPEGVESYADTPGMSAGDVTKAIRSQIVDPAAGIVIANLANVDVVGHIEERDAVVEAVEAVDRELGKIETACRERGVTLVVTADHGTVEEWEYEDGTINTGHTKNPVPFILADLSSSSPSEYRLKSDGGLVNIAPTLLDLLGLEKPAVMTGESLLDKEPEKEGGQRKILLLILDGWGMREAGPSNLISQAHTPHFDRIWEQYPHTRLKASGEAVGMPAGTVGNSEAGHLHIGAGRLILLDRVKIDKAVEDESFFRNPAFLWAMESARREGRALHLLGIVSHYSSHGTIRHLFALLEMARRQGMQNVYVHSLIGRRGERPESGAIYIDKVARKCAELGVGKVVTVMGRFWALDREENWDRIEKTYRALVEGVGVRSIF